MLPTTRFMFLLGAALLAAAALPVSAAPRYEPVVECIGVAGKVKFALGKCPTGGAGGPYKQVKREPRPMPATRAQILERWDMDSQQLAEYETGCAKGDANACGFVEIWKTTSPASIDLGGRATAEKCGKGDKFACEIFEMREKKMREAFRLCEEGDKQMCRRLSNLAQ